jgi:histidine ammonia-lyase
MDVPALASAALTPVTLGPKEGLALINGTQPSTALLGLAVADAQRLARAADIIAALSIDGLQGSTKALRRTDSRGPRPVTSVSFSGKSSNPAGQ